jgi:peptidoglycan/xylan/chitin deacetylase (PgdA/CDA1 family)
MTSRRSAILVVVLCLLVLGIVQLQHTRASGARTLHAPMCRVDTTDRVVALTFDDGPDPSYTSTILQALRVDGSKATFFLTGAHADAHPSLVRDESGAGMEIGNHTWSHLRLAEASLESVRSEIVRTSASIEEATGAKPRLFRAPHGDATSAELVIVAQLGMTSVHWTIALDRYLGELGLDPRSAARRVAGDLRAGDIILAHDAQDGGIGRKPTVRAIELLLPLLREDGYRVVTVGDLLDMGKPVRSIPRPWFWQSGFTCPR